MKKINLLLAIHCHQPVGNFDNVFEEAYEKAYLPFIETVSRYADIKFSLHYSGSLLDWFKSNHPDFLDRIKALIKKGQVELMAGGYYEPILSLLDEEDAIGQIKLLKETLESFFSYEAKGSWLTERVWEPHLSSVLSKAGILYTIVDDSHFKLVSMEPEDLNGYYLCEEQGRAIAIFAGSEKLRYSMPFKLPQQSIDYLKMRLDKSDTDVAVAFADDGEKFGLWPGTHKWVYEQRWLESFLEAIHKNKDWIQTPTFSQYLENHSPSGRVYLTCASYREMMEWSGGYFRNFFTKYEEANNMLSKMRYVSQKIKKVTSQVSQVTSKDLRPATRNPLLDEAKRHLYMGQDNDAYWHGVFGGLYLNHLRSAVYTHLIEAEKIADKILSKEEKGIQEIDLNLDGAKEIIMSNSYHELFFTPKISGALFEWDYKPKSVNLTNTIMRRYEKYHERLKTKYSRKQNGSSVESIHNLYEVKEEGLDKFLYYDSNPRYSLFEHFIARDSKLQDFVTSRFKEKSNTLNKEYRYSIIKGGGKQKLKFARAVSIDGAKLELNKILQADKDIFINYELKNLSLNRVSAIFGTEFNLSIYEPNLSKKPGALEAQQLVIKDSWYGIKFNFTFDKKTKIWYFPVETISESEAGIERTYQELCLFFHWEINLKPESIFKVEIQIELDN